MTSRWIFTLTLLIPISLNAMDRSADLEAIQQSIQENGLHWQAGPTEIFNLTPEERQHYYGALIPVDSPDPERSNYDVNPNRSVLDWRDYDGENWVTGVRDQGSCGSCWDFGSMASFESSVLLATNQPGVDLNLSEQFVLSCIDDAGYSSSCNGGWGYDVFEFITDYGVPLESCFPYEASDGISCEAACNEVEEQLLFLGNWHEITGDWVDVEAINDALMTYGPLQTVYWVYSDFSSYIGGVYQHTWGDMEGGHLVSIVGFNNAERYWIVKNSWGYSWGESGYFRIAYDSGCGFGMYTLAPQYFPPDEVSLYNCVIDDDSVGGSSGDDDGRLNPGEVAAIELQFINNGVNLGSGTATLSIPANGQLHESVSSFTQNSGTIFSLDTPFLVEIPIDAADDAVVNFQVTLDPDNGESRTVQFSRTVGAAQLQVESVLLDDSIWPAESNNDHTPNPGERLQSWFTLYNFGGDIARDIEVEVSSNDPYVTLSDVAFNVEDIEENDSRMGLAPVEILIAPDCPIGHEIQLNLLLISNSGRQFQDQVTLTIHGLDLQLNSRVLTDDSNGNGFLEPGETVQLSILLDNTYDLTYSSATMEFEPLNPEEMSVSGDLVWNELAALTTTMSSGSVTVSIPASQPINSFPVMNCRLISDGYPVREFQLIIPVGDVHILQDGEGALAGMSFDGITSPWHVSRRDYVTSSSSYYFGDEDTGEYLPGAHGWITLFLMDSGPDWHLAFNSRLDLGDGDQATLRMIYPGHGVWEDLMPLEADNHWRHYSIPLTGIPEGVNAIVRFEITADQEDQGSGWYLDDIVVHDTQGYEGVQLTEPGLPQSIELFSNFPNPFNPTTEIRYQTAHPAHHRIQIFDMSGHLVRDLDLQWQAAGYHQVTFDGSDLASGVYMSRLTVSDPENGQVSKTGKMLLLK